MRTLKIVLFCSVSQTTSVNYFHLPPDLSLGVTLSCSNYNYPYLEQITIVQKPLKLDRILIAGYESSCGAVMSGGRGRFRPNDLDKNGLYDPLLRCYWIIPPIQNHTTYLNIRQLDIEESAFCLLDYLKVLVISFCIVIDKRG